MKTKTCHDALNLSFPEERITEKKAYMVDKLKPDMKPALLTDNDLRVGLNCPATKPLPIPWMAIDLVQLYKITGAGMTAGAEMSES